MNRLSFQASIIAQNREKPHHLIDEDFQKLRQWTPINPLKEIIDEEINAYMRDDKELDKVSKDKVMAFWLSEKQKDRFPSLAKLAFYS